MRRCSRVMTPRARASWSSSCPRLRTTSAWATPVPTLARSSSRPSFAHLLEHVTVELLARTNIAGDISTGRTVQTGERSFEVELSCPDDVLVAGALSSAVWIMQWAYSGGGDPKPDVDAIASGLVDLVASVSEQEPAADEPSAEEEPTEQPVSPEAAPVSEEEPAAEPAPVEEQPASAPEPVPAQAEQSAPEPAQVQDGWGAYSGPRPKSVR